MWWWTRCSVAMGTPRGTRAALHVQMVIVVTALWTVGGTEGVCLQDFVSEDSCFTGAGHSSFGPATSRKAEGHDVSSGSCDFRDGMCNYTQGCQGEEDEGKGVWTLHPSPADGYVEATPFSIPNAGSSGGSGNDVRSLTLQSPLLDLGVPSCLTVRASTTGSSSRLHVLLTASGGQGNCTVGNVQSAEGTTVMSSAVNGVVTDFRVNLPVTVAKVMFRAVDKGNGSNAVRLYSVSILPECCIDEDWSSFYSLNSTSSARSPYCQWGMDGWTYRNWAAAMKHVSTLTSPLISAPYPGLHDGVGCLSFRYFLQNEGDVSLEVSLLLGPSGQAVTKWRVFNSNSSNAGQLILTDGQLPVTSVSGQPFRVRLVAKRKTAIVLVQHVTFTRHPATPCPYLPAHGQVVTDTVANSQVAVAGIAGGTSAAVVVVVVVVVSVCAFFSWRKRQRNRSESKEAVVPMNDILQTPPVPSNSSDAIPGDLAQVSHDSGSVSGSPPSFVAATSASDIATNKNTNVDPVPSAADGSRQGNGGECELRSRSSESLPEKICRNHMTNGAEMFLNADDNDLHHAEDAQASGNTRADPQTFDGNHYHMLERDRDPEKATIDHRPDTSSEISNKNSFAGKPETGSEPDHRLGEKNKTGSAVYHMIGEEPETCSGPVGDQPRDSSAIYDKLGQIKGSDVAKARERTRQAYDHVGCVKAAGYDVIQRDVKRDVIDATYDHISGAHRQGS
ncbi:uncharacterized protein LOC143286563 isoform X2 [Babylonia areolata]|uniref:uncharacterized protein LOC143286563 isoform X2 n=1 Tax=Babylonia areolata TaxID=304850 RepID=UPI003FD06CF1